MENKSIPQATSPLAAWLSYLENLHSKTIDMGLERVSQVAARLDVLKPAPFVFTVAGTNGKGTTCRTLESVWAKYGKIVPCSGNTSIFIYPGVELKAIDGLITNFHLPESTLIMLIAAFYGYDKTMAAYKVAVEEKYRFFSFGDAMFIE